MKYSISQITSGDSLTTQNKNLHKQVSSYEFESLTDAIKKCHELNQSWLLDHYKGDSFILVHVPIEV